MPLLLIGLGIGALASQLGAVTVSAVPDDQAPEVGGVQNTMTNLGASIGTALAGSLLIASLSSAFLTDIENSCRDSLQGQVAGPTSSSPAACRSSPTPISTTPWSRRTSRPGRRTRAEDAYQDARITGLRSALAILGVMAIVSLFFARRIPAKQPGST